MLELFALIVPACVPEPGRSGGVELSPSRSGGVERGSHERASCPPPRLSCPPMNEESLDLAAIGDAASEADAASGAASSAAAAAAAAAAVTRLEVRREDFLDARSFLAAPRSRSSPGSISPPSAVGDLLSSAAGSSLCSSAGSRAGSRAAASSTAPPPRGLRLKAPRTGGGGRSPRWDGESTGWSDWQDSRQPRSSRSPATTGGSCGAFCRLSKMDIPRRAAVPLRATFYVTFRACLTFECSARLQAAALKASASLIH